jgi:hypothetical protein
LTNIWFGKVLLNLATPEIWGWFYGFLGYAQLVSESWWFWQTPILGKATVAGP